MHKERRIAAQQHGAISRAQLLELGQTKHQIERRVDTGDLARALPGVFRYAGAPQTERQRLWTASLWAGPTATLSHRAGGALWRMEGVAFAAAELWTPRVLRSSDVIVHRGTVEARDRGRLDGLFVTSPSLTLLDLASVIDELALETAVEDARRRRLVTLDRLRADLERLGGRGRGGSRALRRVLEALDGTAPAESVLEVRVSRILRAAGVLAPVRQFEVIVGGRPYRIDLAWPAMKVGIECEGYATHGRRRAFGPDRSRLADLVGAGWRIIPVTWEQTGDPKRLGALVHHTLLEAAS